MINAKIPANKNAKGVPPLASETASPSTAKIPPPTIPPIPIEIASFNVFQKHEIEFVLKLSEIIASALSTVKISIKTQKLLEESDLFERSIKLLEVLSKEIQMLELKDDIQRKVKSEIDTQQREFLLNQQIKTIQNELGGNPVEKEIEDLKAKAKEKKWNDALVLNSQGNIIESSISNIFWIKDKTVYTPPISEGCIAGIRRANWISTLKEKGIPIIEMPLSKEMLLEADEVFLTNSIRKIRWVYAIENKIYENAFIRKQILKLI